MNLQDFAALTASILTVITIASVIGKYLIVNPLKHYIKEQTYPIQPNANGGRSLADVARVVDKIDKQLYEHIQYHLKEES